MKSEIHITHPPEALQQQTGSDDQHQSYGNLRRNKTMKPAPMSAASGNRNASRFKRLTHGDTQVGERGWNREHDRGQSGQDERISEDSPIDDDLSDTGDPR